VPTIHVLLAGGGTAGHVEPALATADALVELGEQLGVNVEITMLGTASGLETRLVPARGFRLETIPRVPLPRRPSADLLTVPMRLRGAVRAADAVMVNRSIDVVVGFGGYVALPAYFAARRRHLPMVVHEANVRAGVANRIGARMTALVATGLPGTRLPHARLVGMPLRRAIATVNRAALKQEALASFGLDQRPVLLVFGGSQGASRINAAVLDAQAQVASVGGQILLATGEAGADLARTQADQTITTVVDYIDRMDLAYAAADLAVARAGAMTCAELAAVGLGAVLVPLPIGNGEQRLNAEPLVTAGAAVIIDDSDFTGPSVVDRVVPILADPSRLAAMDAAALRLGRRDADRVLARMVLGAVLPGVAGSNASGADPTGGSDT